MATLNKMSPRIKSSKLTVFLFVILCLVLIFTNFMAGGLIALAVWLQIYLQFFCTKLSKHSQIWAFKIFLCAIPLLFFWGGVHAFLILHFKEHQWSFFFLSFILDALLVFIGNLQLVWIFQVAHSSHFEVDQSFKQLLSLIKKNKKYFLITSAVLLLLIFFPILSVEWKIVIALVCTQLFIFRLPLKRPEPAPSGHSSDLQQN